VPKEAGEGFGKITRGGKMAGKAAEKRGRNNVYKSLVHWKNKHEFFGKNFNMNLLMEDNNDEEGTCPTYCAVYCIHARSLQ
jgi:hypothetical protein